MAVVKMNAQSDSPFKHATFLYLSLALAGGALTGNNDISIYWCILPFAAGIVYYFHLTSQSTDASRLIRNSHRHIIWMMLLCFGFGMLSMSITKPPEYDFENDTFPPYAFGRIQKMSYTNSGENIIVDVHGFTDRHSEEFKTRPFKVLLHTDATDCNIGDEIYFINTIKHIEPNRNFHEADNRYYNRDIIYTANISSQFICKYAHTSTLTSISTEIRDHLIIRIEKSNLSADTRNFIITSLLGDSSYITSDNRQILADAGIAHILAISGLHIGIISFAIGLILMPLNLLFNHRVRFILIIILLWTFAFISGLSASVVRACVMATFYYGAIILERKNNSFNALCAAAFFIIALSPMSIFDIGLQLSFATVAGILLLSGHFTVSYHKKYYYISKLSSIISVTIIATLFSWMLTAYYFNSFPLLFLPINLIVIPLLPPYFIIGLIYIILINCGYDITIISDFLDLGYHELLNLIIFIGADSSNTYKLFVSPTTVIAYYIMLAAITAMIYNRRNITILISLATTIIFIVSCVVFPGKRPGNCCIVQNNPNGIFIRSYTNSCDTLIEAKRNVCEEIFLHGNIIVSIDDDHLPDYTSARKKCDIMLIGNGFRGDMTMPMKLYNPQLIIFMNSLPEEKETEYQYQTAGLHIPTYSIRNKGPILIPSKQE